MNAETEKQLEQAAHDYIRENQGSIEVYNLIVPHDCIPEDEEDPEGWVSMNGAEIEGSSGFKVIGVTTDNGIKGYALVTVVGHSWEGLRIFLEGVFENESEALARAATMGIVC